MSLSSLESVLERVPERVLERVPERVLERVPEPVPLERSQTQRVHSVPGLD